MQRVVNIDLSKMAVDKCCLSVSVLLILQCLFPHCSLHSYENNKFTTKNRVSWAYVFV